MAHRKYLIAGNWKMNITSTETVPLMSEIIEGMDPKNHVDVLVCPPFTSLVATKSSLSSATNIFLGAQNFFPEKNGAYTGEVSAVMLRELGVSHVIAGHSERRIIFGESDEFINKKVKNALSTNLIPILCVGETIEHREKGVEFDVVGDQVRKGLKGVTTTEASKVVIAYEPVWAIGTGQTATPEIAQTMHAFIRDTVKSIFNEKVANNLRILYGGSMKPSNAEALLKKDGIDGGLIGGASLKATEFCQIISIANKLA